ncbi:DNA double-strand break repair nuclease NurA [Dactylosporangium sp. NPDC005572]|uniref:DNA double-strand break repair nuclease NurA n=1 Tax=Dactylosporangium sp. NPDC005572 TaxID=3156889 RepID=UPI00339F47E4
MPYEGEFASYRPLHRITGAARVKALLGRSRVFTASAGEIEPTPTGAPATDVAAPEFVIAIDGSTAEVDVVNGYPGAKVGYCTVASVLLNLKLVELLDQSRPIDPVKFRQTEEPSTIDAALPGSNVVTRDHISARDSFREALYEIFHDEIIDEDDQTRLLDTYEELLALKPLTNPPACPYESVGCDRNFPIPARLTSCPCDKRRAVYSTDALRVHERFRETGSNGEAFGEVMQVWERVLLLHLLRCFERRGWLAQLTRFAFMVDGPLALFGHPAWLSAAISSELKRINSRLRAETGRDLLLLGIEKSGTFVEHFAMIDQTERPGELLFQPRDYFMPTDKYIKRRVVYSASEKRYGLDTYFGRKVFYKTTSGARIVFNTPFLSDAQDTLESSDESLYSQLPVSCSLLDKMVSSRYQNAVSPIVSAHAYAAIPLSLGSKVLQQLARALMRDGAANGR